ncbi:YfzA family protein [Halalkalibacter okhensis]|uniref:Group-specific protein n=1 Tax=Halalkalibacter okhensis TaxID=333138 RepID=A0A0B0IND8_9BACI|nr:YfzA family protein [Halalkalibacter okhensis]KHF41594.1 hypothetical protein LQ50_02490 [Halalkalibacter okhensis]
MSGARTENLLETNGTKRWVVTFALFCITQLIFIAVDGTFLEPNINDSDNLIARLGRWMLDAKLFTEWITPYSYPFFNLCVTIHVIAILIYAAVGIITKMSSKK